MQPHSGRGRSEAASRTALQHTRRGSPAGPDRQVTTTSASSTRGWRHRGRWWAPSLGLAAVATAALVLAATAVIAPGSVVTGTQSWWIATIALHAPLAVILALFAGGLVERGKRRRRRTGLQRPGEGENAPELLVTWR